MTPRTQYAEVDGRSLAYQVFGTGPHEIVYVWGTLSHLDWYWSDPDVTHLLRRAAARARILMYDRAGSGLSDPMDRYQTVEERAADIALLIDEVGFRRPHLVGIVDGAAAALYLAATQPNTVGRLQLLSPWLKGPGPEPWSIREQVYEQWHDAIDHWGDGRSLDLVAPSMKASPFHRRLWGTFERSAMSRGTARTLVDANRDIDVTPLLGSLQVPTLVMTNRHDPAVPADGTRALAEKIPDATYVELNGRDVGIAYNDDADEAVDMSLAFLIGEGPVVDGDRAFVTVMFSDIVGSTTTLATMGDIAWQRLLREHEHVTRALLDQYDGTEISRLGDGYVATFQGPVAAIRCGAALIDAMEERGIDLRVGLHSGEVSMLGSEPTGIAMHVAARVAALADGGQVLVSSAVRALVDDASAELTSVGTHELKGVPGAHELFAAQPRQRTLTVIEPRSLTLQDRLIAQSVRRTPAVSRALIRMTRRAS